MVRVNWVLPVNHRDYNRMPASAWIRALQLIPYLEEHGIRSTVNAPPESSQLSIFIRRIDTAALAAMQRARAAGTKTLLDLCVNYLEPSGTLGTGYGSTVAQRDLVLRLLAATDGVLCASEEIARAARAHHERVLCLPDSIDLRHFCLRKDPADFSRRPLRFLFAGVAAKTDYLFSVIQPLLRKHGAELVVLAERRPSWWRRYRFRRWRYERFPEDLLSAEIGLAPRAVDTPYDRGHSAFKIAVHLAQGVPVLASPVPSYRDILSSGQTGRICESADAWAEAILAVCKDREMIRGWSHAAPDAVTHLSTETVSTAYAGLFRSILNDADLTPTAIGESRHAP